MRFNITWRDGAYKVSVPNYDGGEVVTADEYDVLGQKFTLAQQSIKWVTAEKHSAQAAEERVRNDNYVLRQRVADLERQLVEAQQDTARLDWIEADPWARKFYVCDLGDNELGVMVTSDNGNIPGTKHVWKSKTLRAAIDDARAKKGLDRTLKDS